MDIIEIESSESDDDLDVEWDDSPEEWPTDHSGGLDMNSFQNLPSSSNNDGASHLENSVSSSRQWRETFDTDLHNNSRSNEGEGTSSLTYPHFGSDGENFQGRVLPPSFRSYAYKPSSDHSSSRFHRGSISNLRKEPTQVKQSNGSAVDLTNIAYDRNKLGNKMYQNTQSRILPPSFQQTMHTRTPKGPVDYRGKKVFDIEDKHKFPSSASVNANAGGGARMLPPSFRSDKSRSATTPGATIDDDVLIYRTSGTHRILPPSLNGKCFDNSQLAVSADARTRSGLGEQRIMEHDERAIYQEALQNLGQPKLEDDLPEGLLSVSLLKHQKIALAWMVLRENSVNGAGGILADDQGLGKTISMIALVQKQRPIQSKFTSDDSQQTKPEALNLDDDDDEGIVDLDKEKQVENLEKKHVPSTSIRMSSKWRRAAGTLVVCPASVLRQWARELDEKVTTSAKLSVLIYHGGARTRDPADLAKYDVVLTTYAIVSNEVPKQAIAQDDEGDQRNLDKYEISSEFSSKKRKQETGRPSKGKKKGKRLKDSDVDYDCGPLARVRWFRVILDEAQTIKNHRTQVARACSGLRAKRRWCLSGTPIQNSIDDLFSYFRFLKYEPYSSYSSFCNKIKYPISKSASDGYKKLQVVLRNILLRRTKGTLINGEPIINLPPKTVLLNKVEFSSEERLFYLKLEADSRQQFKKYAAAGTLKQNYASILLMLLRLRQACDHPVLVKGCHSNTTGTDSLEMARQLPRDMLSNLLSHLEGSLAICSVCSDPPEDAVVTMCGHVFCYQCVSERLTGDDNQCPAAGCKQTLGIESVFSRATLESCIYDKTDSSTATSGLTHEEEPSIAQSAFVSSKIKAALDIINSLCSSSCNSLSREYGKQDCNMVDTGAKMDACSCESTNIEGPIKAIVFSQWTGMLDLLEHSLNQSLIQYRRLDGTMSIALRDKAVKEFNTDPEVTVMLMSLKAGNLGLNMVAACHVIMLDLWWNPTSEDQAVDRAHRIGQTRPVTVSRLTVKDTVEDRILALQEEKRKMVSSAFGEDQSSGHATKLTLEDVRYLFGFN